MVLCASNRKSDSFRSHFDWWGGVRCSSPSVMKVLFDCPVTSSETWKYTQTILKHTYNFYVKASSNFATCQLPTSIRHAHSTRKYAPSNIRTTISVCELHPGLRLQKYPFPFSTQPDCRPLNPKLLELLNTSVMTENMKPMICPLQPRLNNTPCASTVMNFLCKFQMNQPTRCSN